MRNRWRISAGVIDAGFASLATFGIGVFAIRYFDAATLGGYALVFAAFKLAVFIPQELIFVPAEVAAVSHSQSARLSLLSNSMRLGVVPALFAAVLVSLWALAAPSSVSVAAAVAFTWTGMACVFVSPMQDHLRRMLHIAGRSWLAAFLSVVQSVGVIGTLAYMLRVDVPMPWIPFGSLLIANIVSLVAGAVLLRRDLVAPADGQPLFFMELAQYGKWFLIASLLAPASAFLASVLVSHLASAEALGYAEAARIIGRPLQVLALGLSTVLSRQSVNAALQKNLVDARRMSQMHVNLMLTCAAIYLLAAGFDVPWNPLATLLPNAYVITGLASATILADVVTVLLLPHRFELLGGRRARALTKIEAMGAVLRSLLAATAGWTQAFAMPLGQCAIGAARWIGYRRVLLQYYNQPGPRDEPDGVPSARQVERMRIAPGPASPGDADIRAAVGGAEA